MMIVLVMMGESLFIIFMIYLGFYMMSYKNMGGLDLISSYECGFEVNSFARIYFSYRFFLIAILFLIFDVEVVLILPLPVFCSGIIFYIFIVVLILGLFYEYYWGSLDWL